MNGRGYGLVLVALAMTVYGQLIVKWRVDLAGDLPAGLSDQLRFVFRLLVDPWIISTVVFTLVAALAYFAALTQLPLSRAYPVMALSFVIVVVASSPLYGESLSALRLLGLTLMMAGVLIASRA